MLLELISEPLGGLARGLAHELPFVGKKLRKNYNNWDHMQEKYRDNLDTYYNKNLIPVGDNIMGAGTAAAGSVLNQMGYAVGRTAGLATKAAGYALGSPFYFGYKAFRGVDRGIQKATNDKYGLPTPWRVARTLGAELPGEVMANGKMIAGATMSAGKVAHKAAQATNTPTIGMATVAAGGLLGVGIGQMRNGEGFLEGVPFLGERANNIMNSLGLQHNYGDAPHNYAGIQHQYNEGPGGYNAPTGGTPQVASGYLMPGSTGEFSPNSGLRQYGADGNLPLALHDMR